MNEKQIAAYNELMPAQLEQKIKLAKYLSESGLMPQGLKSPAQVLVALQMGHELGLAPMVAVNNIAVIRGKPTLSSQIMDAIVRSHPDFTGMSVDTGDTKATVSIKRRIGDNTETYTSTFSVGDAKRAGLLPGKPDSAWATYPQRMLKHRALAFAARDAFPDALAGMYTKEEMMDVAREPRDVTPEGVPDDLKKGGNDSELSIEELENMLSKADLQSIENAVQRLDKFVDDNKEYIEPEHIQYAQSAREVTIKRYFQTGDIKPAEAIDKINNRLHVVVDAKKKRLSKESTINKEAAEDAEIISESGRGTEEAEGHQPEEDIDEELNALSKDGDENEGTLF
jgi:hypothetical protein